MKKGRRHGTGPAVSDYIRGQAKVEGMEGHNWDALDRLHRKEYISDPATKAKSVLLTEAGAKRSQELFEKYFTK